MDYEEFKIDRNVKSITVQEAAKLYKKDPCWIRAGLICGWLPIGFATRRGKKVTSVSDIGHGKGRINYYISPKLLADHLGISMEEILCQQ